MKNYITAKHLLNAISVHEPESISLELKEIAHCIKTGKKSDTFPELSSSDLKALVEEFLEESGSEILMERTLLRILKEANIRVFVRNVLRY